MDITLTGYQNRTGKSVNVSLDDICNSRLEREILSLKSELCDIIRKCQVTERVAYVQEPGLLNEQQIQTYMPNIPYIISTDTVAITDFVVFWSNRGIRNFILNINSGILTNLINSGLFSNPLFGETVFVATRSNANSVRDANVPNLYFSLSALSIVVSILPTIDPTKSLVVVSDTNNAFFDQIFNTRNYDRIRLSNLTVPILNTYAATANVIYVALQNLGEYQTLASLILDPGCNYTNKVTFIEIDPPYVSTAQSLLSKISNITINSSNVSLTASTSQYPGINEYMLYDNCSISLSKYVSSWKSFITNQVIAKGLSDRSSVFVPLIMNME